MQTIKKIVSILLLVLIMTPNNVYAATVQKVSCGNSSQGLSKFPKKIPQLTTFGVNLIQVAVPVIIILLGMIDLIKAITSGKEDDIKKGQNILVKRLITGAIVFFVFVIVKLVISAVGNINATSNSNSNGIIHCMECFMNYHSCRNV